MRKILILLFTALILISPAYALDPGEMFEDPAQEERARELGRQLRCLKCRNQSIFDSNAGLAKDLRVVVRERMVAGDSDAEVLSFISERFGDYVLLKPRVSIETYVLWITPFVMMALGLMAVLGYHRGRRKSAPAPELTEAEREHARKLLSKEGQ